MKLINIAYHEAGHLVADLFYNLKPTDATIIKNKNEYGSVSSENRLRPDYSEEEKMDACFNRSRLKPVLIFDEVDEDEQKQKRIARKQIRSLLAGYMAEKKFNPSANVAGAYDDFKKASKFVDIAFHLPKKYYDKDGIPNFYRFLESRFIPQAEKLVNEHWEEITYTANLLHKNKTLSETDINNLRQTLKQKRM